MGRKQGSRWLRGTLLAAALLGVLVAAWPAAEAGDKTVAELVKLIESQPARHRKAMALKELCDLDSIAARKAVIALAKSGDDATALCALSALSREDFTGARKACEDVLADSKRSDVVRSAALGACLKLRKGDGKKWADIKTWVGRQTKGESELGDFSTALSKKLWKAEVSGE